MIVNKHTNFNHQNMWVFN